VVSEADLDCEQDPIILRSRVAEIAVRGDSHIREVLMSGSLKKRVTVKKQMSLSVDATLAE
jgi:hypothetical protein